MFQRRTHLCLGLFDLYREGGLVVESFPIIPRVSYYSGGGSFMMAWRGSLEKGAGCVVERVVSDSAVKCCPWEWLQVREHTEHLPLCLIKDSHFINSVTIISQSVCSGKQCCQL